MTKELGVLDYLVIKQGLLARKKDLLKQKIEFIEYKGQFAKERLGSILDSIDQDITEIEGVIDKVDTLRKAHYDGL